MGISTEFNTGLVNCIRRQSRQIEQMQKQIDEYDCEALLKKVDALSSDLKAMNNTVNKLTTVVTSQSWMNVSLKKYIMELEDENTKLKKGIKDGNH